MAIVFIRTLILYVLVIIGVRLMGKRQVGELQTSELVTTILLSNISILPIQETSIPLIYGIIPLLSLICFEVILSFICLKSTKTRNIVSGRPKVIINNGIIDQQLLKDLRFSIDDLVSQLRQQQVFDIKDVQTAILETNGTISVYQKFHARNVNTLMLNIPSNNTTNSAPQFIVVSDGTIINDNLSLCNKDEKWVYSTLKSKKRSLEEVLLLTCDGENNYTLIPKEG